MITATPMPAPRRSAGTSKAPVGHDCRAGKFHAQAAGLGPGVHIRAWKPRAPRSAEPREWPGRGTPRDSARSARSARRSARARRRRAAAARAGATARQEATALAAKTPAAAKAAIPVKTHSRTPSSVRTSVARTSALRHPFRSRLADAHATPFRTGLFRRTVSDGNRPHREGTVARYFMGTVEKPGWGRLHGAFTFAKLSESGNEEPSEQIRMLAITPRGDSQPGGPMHLDEHSDTPFYRQLEAQLREGIESGTYPTGSRLPSIRGLAADLGCARNTVEQAYHLLVQEGYVASRPGSGYVVQNVAYLQPDASAPSCAVLLGGPRRESPLRLHLRQPGARHLPRHRLAGHHRRHPAVGGSRRLRRLQRPVRGGEPARGHCVAAGHAARHRLHPRANRRAGRHADQRSEPADPLRRRPGHRGHGRPRLRRRALGHRTGALRHQALPGDRRRPRVPLRPRVLGGAAGLPHPLEPVPHLPHHADRRARARARVGRGRRRLHPGGRLLPRLPLPGALAGAFGLHGRPGPRHLHGHVLEIALARPAHELPRAAHAPP